MFDWVHIARLPERDLNSFNANMHEGLQVYTFTGYLLMIGSLLFFIIALFTLRMIVPYILISLVFFTGFYFHNYAKKSNQKRVNCITYGELVSSRVIEHGRTFTIFSSKKKYSITIFTEDKNHITISHTSEELWHKFPIGATVLGLKYKGEYLFGPEMNIDLKLFKNQ